jgi:hypothetical protein
MSVFDNDLKKEFKPGFSPFNLRPNRTPHTLTSSAIAETGCSGHYLMMNSPCSNAKPTKNGVSVLLPDGGTIRATQTAKLPIKALPYAAQQAHLFPALSSGALHKNVRSTKPNPPKPSPQPFFEQLDQRTNIVFANVFEPTRQIYTDLPGRFPIQSNRSNQYKFVL